jgi:hypothetical protein
MNGQEHATRIEQFRHKVYQNFNKRADTMMDLLDAICSQTNAKSVVELSLESCYQRSYSTIFKAIAKYKPKEGELAELAGPELPKPQERKYWVLGIDVTPQPRPYARTLKGRGFVYQPTIIKGNKPITIGHQYSTIALLPEKDQVHPIPWIIPLSVQRVQTHQKKAEAGAEQMGKILDHQALPFDKQLCIEVGDSDYSQPQYLSANRKHKNFISIVRSRGNRVYYQRIHDNDTGGAPKRYGERFSLKDPETWHPPDEQVTVPFTSRRGQPYQIDMRAWHNMIMPGKVKPVRIRMHRYPFTLVRIVMLDQDEKPIYQHPLWLLVVGKRRHELSLEEIHQAYAQRSDLEHFFRFGKQKLLLTSFQTPEIDREENWWHLVHLAYLQLWATKDVAACIPRPWERSLPIYRHGAISPTVVQHNFQNLLSQFGSPAKHPKPRGKSPGRKLGFRLAPRPRQNVIRKSQIPLS